MWLPFVLLGLSTSLVAAATNSSPNSSIICSNSVYEPFLDLSAYAPAESYCSKLYPVAPVTLTLTAPTTTRTITANWTLSITITDSALTNTVTAAPITAITSLDTVTTTTIIDTVVTETAPVTTSFTMTTLTEISTLFTTETVTAGAQSPEKRDTSTGYPVATTSTTKAYNTGKKKCHHKSISSTTINATSLPTTFLTPTSLTTTSLEPTSFTSTTLTSNTTALKSAAPVGDCGPDDVLCSIFSSLTKTAKPVISTVCSCIETPETTTVTTTPSATFITTPLTSVATTPIDTSTVTPTVTETVTPSTTASITNVETVTEMPTQTITVTATTTTTTTSTATATVQAWCASGPSAASNTCSCSYSVSCDSNFGVGPTVSQTAPDLAACQTRCDMYLNCLAYSFSDATNSCGLYITIPSSRSSAAGFAAAVRSRGTCSNSGCEAYF
ncbi:hypothetical protein F5X99DRAFT_404704 [Biscogniauxia marginata]|nr:hypothetical protein F5X99DRAFT_404704 [Biscogniauxia marginata]